MQLRSVLLLCYLAFSLPRFNTSLRLRHFLHLNSTSSIPLISLLYPSSTLIFYPFLYITLLNSAPPFLFYCSPIIQPIASSHQILLVFSFFSRRCCPFYLFTRFLSELLRGTLHDPTVIVHMLYLL